MQVSAAGPATAVGEEIMVSVFVAVPFVQPGLNAVNVNVTLPAIISAALGVYVQVDNELAFVKVPVPLELHTTET